MGNYSKLRRKSKPAFVHLSLFGEALPPLPAVTVDTVYWQNNQYKRKNGLYYQVINKNEYEVVDQFVISQVHAVWLDQNSTGETLFNDAETNI